MRDFIKLKTPEGSTIYLNLNTIMAVRKTNKGNAIFTVNEPCDRAIFVDDESMSKLLGVIEREVIA